MMLPSQPTAAEKDAAEELVARLERADAVEPTLEILTALADVKRTSAQEDRMDAALGRLVVEVPSESLSMRWCLLAVERFAFQAALDRTTLAIERWPERGWTHMMAARATNQLCRMADCHRHVLEAFERAGQATNPLEPIFQMACAVGMPALARQAIGPLLRSRKAHVHMSLVQRLEIALHNQRPESPCHRARLISLGQNCLPWMMPLRWGLLSKPAAAFHVNPFNLASWLGGGLTVALEERFAAFDDAGSWRIARSPLGLHLPQHQPYGAVFNHEAALASASEGLVARVMRLQRQRADNFLANGVKGTRVYLFAMERVTDLARLLRALEEIGRDAKFVLLVLNMSNDPAAREAVSIRDERLRCHDVKRPAPDYVWASQFSTPAGVDFERDLHDVILETLEDAVERHGPNRALRRHRDGE